MDVSSQRCIDLRTYHSTSVLDGSFEGTSAGSMVLLEYDIESRLLTCCSNRHSHVPKDTELVATEPCTPSLWDCVEDEYGHRCSCCTSKILPYVQRPTDPITCSLLGTRCHSQFHQLLNFQRRNHDPRTSYFRIKDTDATLDTPIRTDLSTLERTIPMSM